MEGALAPYKNYPAAILGQFAMEDGDLVEESTRVARVAQMRVVQATTVAMSTAAAARAAGNEVAALQIEAAAERSRAAANSLYR